MRPAQAVRRISEGDLGFIFRARPSRLGELLTLHSGAAFYAGLLAESQAAAFLAQSAGEAGTQRKSDSGRSVDTQAVNAAARVRIAEALYTVSLESPSPIVREAAAQKLIPLVLSAGDKDAVRRVVQNIQSETGSSWEKLFALIDALPGKVPPADEAGDERSGAVRDLAGFFLTAQTDDAYRWGWTVVDPAFFTSAESAAVTGRLAAARSSFAEALASFRKTLEREETLFFRYPALLSDLGRAFQFTAAAAEGSALFQKWEKRFSDGTMGDAAPQTRYLLRYFAGRMERHLGHSGEAVEIFARALDAAFDPEQEDACMWYILDITQSANPESFIPVLKTYLPRWNSPPYFTDILERQAMYFTAQSQWDALLEVYSFFPKEDGWAARGQYAYILGRAVSLGLFDPGPDGPPDPAAAFFQAAREEPAAAFYYRALAGHFLNAPAIVVPKKPKAAPRRFPHSDVMEFLLGFFYYGAADHIDPYLKNFQETLSVEELRDLAEAAFRAERWDETIRITVLYMSRKEYRLTRRDLELSFPRPFRDLTEAYAQETGIPAPLLYGLIRTESFFDPDIHSHAGAVGLTQLMTATALDMAARLDRRGGPQYAENGKIDLQDPETNLHLGAVYLRYLMDTFKSPMLAVLAYNGGMGRVRRWRAAESRLPEDLFPETIAISETRNYGRRVFSAAAVYGYLYYGISMEEIVTDIIK
ncbi:MAG: lytic transglycosylase domain-containing protein [Spirochaetaceae bacterium]|nr:lytic transglycosylase domain-containing protein [Spirochaetaceae bacterium]